MAVANCTIELSWKEFNVNLEMVKAAIAAIGGEEFCGSSADTCLKVHFNEDPGQSVKDAVAAYWDGVLVDGAEATGYESAADIAAVAATKKASGKAKLLALGLTEEEVNALLG